MRTNTTADRRERIFFLDQFQGVFIFAQRRKSDVALNGDMGRTCRFARRSTALESILSVFAIIDVPLVFAPNGIANGVVFLCFNRSFRTYLLTESDGVGRTVFDALSACDAVLLIDFGMVVASFGIRTIEHCRDADCKARASAAVAYCRRFARPFEVGHLVHQAVFFRFFENGFGFFSRDLSCLAGFYKVFRARTHLDAHIVFKVSAAFVQQTP